MSYSVQPHRRQPTRLHRGLEEACSPGKNTGVGCHFLLQCMKVKSESEVAQSCLTLSDPMDCSPPGSSVHGIFQARVLEWGAIAFSEERTSLNLKKKMLKRNVLCFHTQNKLAASTDLYNRCIKWTCYWLKILLSLPSKIHLLSKNKISHNIYLKDVKHLLIKDTGTR